MKVLSLALAGAIICAAAQTPQPVKLRMGGKPGDTISYKIDLSISAGPTDHVSLKGKLIEKLVKVSKGEFTWEDSAAGLKATGEGQLAQFASEFVGGAHGPFSTTYDAQGKVTNYNSGLVNSVLPYIAFPKGAIKVGQQWKDTSKISGEPVAMTFKFVRLEKVGGAAAAVVACTFDPASRYKAASPAMVWVDLRDGRPRRVESKMRVKDTGRDVGVSLKLVRE